MNHIGLDGGNWAFKAVRSNMEPVIIRNVAAHYDGSDDALRGLGLFGQNTDDIEITLGDERWLLGEAAWQYNARAQTKTTYTRYGTDEWYALVAGVFARLYHNSCELSITMNVPVSQIRANRHRDIAEMLEGTWTVGYGGREVEFMVEASNVMVIPEGFGGFMSQVLSVDGKKFANRELASSRVAVFDFGGYTLDITTYNGLEFGSFNESITTGLIDVRNAVNTQIKRLYNRGDIPGDILDNIIQTSIYRHAGSSPIDVSGIVDSAMVSLMQDALRIWNEDLGAGVDFDSVIILGGGGPVIGPMLSSQIRHNNISILPKETAHIANAIGAWRYGKFRQQYMAV